MLQLFLSWFTKAVFVTLLLGYIFFSLIEEFREGFVSNYFSLNWLLVAVLVSAILFFIFQAHHNGEVTKKTKPIFLFFISGLTTLALIWFGAREFELFWRVILSLFGGFMVVGILLVLFED